MTDQMIFRQFQQLQEEIAALDDVTAAFARVLQATMQPEGCVTSLNGTSQQSPIQEELLATAQQIVESRQQTLRQFSHRLQGRINQLETLYTIANQYGEATSMDRVLATAMDAIWKKTPLSFLVVILGESELGPYHYHAMRGVANAWQYIKNHCPFPLWGILARALLPRLNPDEPDLLVVNDIAIDNRSLCEEFPWMPGTGSLMILPLRANNHACGAMLLGSKQANEFADELLCEDFLAIAFQTTRVLELAQMNQELNERAGQLLSLQLFTKSITTAHNYDKLVDVLFEGIFEAMGRVGVSILFGDQSWHREINGSTVIPDHARRIIDWAMQAGQPIFYDPEDSEGSLERFYYNDSGYALVVPILRNERTHGAIQITSERSHRFEEGDMIVLRTIANCVAIIMRDIDT